MNNYLLVEDTCLGKGLDFDQEKSKLDANPSYTLVHEGTHPAIGRIAEYTLVALPTPNLYVMHG
jgi:hypothetical protein